MKLIYICLIISVLGILVLFFISSVIKPLEINSNSSLKEKDYVKINGKIISEKSYDDFSVLNLQDSKGRLQITCNCKGFVNTTVEVIGKVELYNKDFQIAADKITEK